MSTAPPEETITLTRAELEKQLERAKGQAWAEARKKYEGKSKRLDEIETRLANVERLLVGVITNQLSPAASGAAEPTQAAEEKEQEHATE